MEEYQFNYDENQEPTYPRKPEKPKKRIGMRVAVVALVCALVGSLCGGGLVGVMMHRMYTGGETVSAKPVTTPQTTNVSTVSYSSAESGTLSSIYQASVPGIVGISNESTYNFYGQVSETASSGTGFIISSDGEILTNYHVVEGANTLTVTLSDGSKYPATVVGYEAESDVALLKIDAEGLTPLTLGDSDVLTVGDEVAAIGNPLGELTYTMTVGYVSALERQINTDGTPINMMQVDAAINPGNSGGPLFNMAGQVIGITTAKYSGSTGSGATIEGIGFAIPINDVKEILDDLRENGAVLDRAYLGVRVSDVSEKDAENYNLPMGALVASVDKGSAADKAGIRKSDIIVGLGDSKIESLANLSTALRSYRAGDTATVTVYRNGSEVELTIVFDEKPTQEEETTTSNHPFLP